MAYPSDLVRTKNWGNEVLTDADIEGQLDLIINWVMAALNAVTGHKHDGTQNEGPKILINNLNIAAAAQGDVIFRNATVFARLAAGVTGLPLVTKGAAADPIYEALAAAGLAADAVETAKIKDKNVIASKVTAIVGTAVDKSADYGAQEALTDGFVTVYASMGQNIGVAGYTDANADPATKMHDTLNPEAIAVHRNFTMLVKKGNYWKLIGTGAPATLVVYWIPLGS